MDATSTLTLPPGALSGEEPRARAIPRPKKPAKPARSVEPLSPFVPWSESERTTLPELSELSTERQFLGELLREPASIVERLLEPSRLQGLILGSVGIIAGCTSLFAATVSAARGEASAWASSSALASVNVLMALAASLGPIYAASILLATRVPLARLVAALLASAATGSLILAGMAPPLYLLWRLDSEWTGPLMLLLSFLLSGWVAGARVHRLLNVMAEAVTRSALGDATAVLDDGDAFRVGILARVSWMMLAFTSALGLWAFQALG
ncbi:MAG TPA: hypothetical protein VK420_14015 [Longimicrobium sp.]|nr:hypothetical protein [Longimicrobium sp.]